MIENCKNKIVNNCQEKSTGVTVTGASPYRASVLLENKFRPLQMVMVEDHIDNSSNLLLQGQKSDRSSLTQTVI